MLNHELIQISSFKTKKFHDECLQFQPIYCLISKHKQAQLYEKKKSSKKFFATSITSSMYNISNK